ncbi:MAG: HupE/UreJ family protein [Gammaproteobacteria bacterium]|nr:HupE/UreJ family protein [Gammaproteobacteria bacterium]
MITTLVRLLLTTVLLGWFSTQPVFAHEVPTDAHIRLLVKADGAELHALVRVPLEAMRDFDFALFGPGYLDIDAAALPIRDAAMLWLAGDLNLTANGAPLGDQRLVAARISLPADRSFDSYATARAHVHKAPLPNDINLHWQQAMLDVEFVYDIDDQTAELAINPTLSRLSLATQTTLTFVLADGTERRLHYQGDPGYVAFDPAWYQALASFVTLGIDHVWSGTDHLLFVLCLLIPFSKLRPLVAIVTSFTVAHSITLASAALGFVPTASWFAPFIEVLIAVSIVFMAFENMLGANLNRRLPITFGFGLVHGFAFAYALSSGLQFAGDHIAPSLLGFNLGIEIGQIAILVIAIPLIRWLLRHLPERGTVVLLSAIIAHSAWHWLEARYQTFARYDMPAWSWDTAMLASSMRWMMVLLIAVGVYWGLRRLFKRWLVVL